MIRLENVDDEKFRIIMSNLRRIGVTKKDYPKTIFQTAYIIKAFRGVYLVHFKEIQGEPMRDVDYTRLVSIARALWEWGLVSIAPDDCSAVNEKCDMDSILILSRGKVEEEGWKHFSIITMPKIKAFIGHYKEKLMEAERGGSC